MMYDAGYVRSIPLVKKLRSYANAFLHCPSLQYDTCRPAQISVSTVAAATFDD